MGWWGWVSEGGGDDVSSAMMTTAIMEAWTTSSAVLAVRVRWEQ